MKHKKYTCFQDYPKNIQQEAKKILHEKPLDNFKEFPKEVQEEAKEALIEKPKNAIK